MPMYETPDANRIAVSYDGSCAIRIRDGLRLVSFPDSPRTRCDGCAVPHGHTSCPGHMARNERKCRRNNGCIIWRPAND